ncbi:hypothetical protein DIURU_000707 [Diutina rugosa]|uniref:Transcription activator GCR1-like domain-containing protein n=1 Tax=Diutina rugosa TaxID=5481 RepID=A0A642V1J8_DIURU|nr:uncharacterized protein DIURU_000707 [Diutina rugosa]KAA8907023.1 hypothetical protein DIURU_000707 [Diutina rugosa]
MTTIDQLYVVVSRISAQCHDQSELITTLSTKLDVLVQQVDSLKILAHEASQSCMAVHSQTIGSPVERMVEHMSQQLLLLQRSVDDLRPERRPQQLATTTNNYANSSQHPPPPKAPGARLANSFAAPQLPRPQLQPQLQPQGQPQGQQAHLPLRGMPHRVNSHDGSAGDEKYDHQDIPKYRMERSLKSISEIWREYEYGLNDKPPLKQLELQYGTKWRNETESRTFLRRKKIYEAIEVGKQKGYTEDEIIADLEEHRSYNVNGSVKRYPLSWLVVNMPAKYTNDP